MDQSLEELRAKLSKSKQQLKQVRSLLNQQPDNDTLISLRKDLEQVIQLTEDLVATKEEKNRDPAKEPQRRQPPGGQGGAPAAANAALRPKKEIPREWGDEKDEWKVQERCQVRYDEDKRWYIGQVIQCIIDPNTGTNQYKIMFLDHVYGGHSEYVTTSKNMRTYVVPLPDQIQVGSKVRACWDHNGLFYPATIDEVLPGGHYTVTFDKYGQQNQVPLDDIQLIKEKKPLISQDTSGRLVVPERAPIPQHLWSNDNDTPQERSRKHKKIKLIKKNHRKLQLEVESKNRQSDWKSFMDKGTKKRKKKLRGSLMRTSKSIFESPNTIDGRVGVASTGEMTSFDQRTNFHHLRRDPNEE